MITIILALAIVMVVLILLLFGGLIALGCFIWFYKTAASTATGAANQFMTAGVQAQVNSAASSAIISQHRSAGDTDTDETPKKLSRRKAGEVKGFASYHTEGDIE